MKIKRRLSIVVAFMLLFMITFPVTGAFAAENSEQKANSQQDRSSKQGEWIQNDNNSAAKTNNQKEKSNGDVKAASTEKETVTEEDTETETAADQTGRNSEEGTTNQPEASENSDNQQSEMGEENTATEENDTPEENNAAEESDTPEEKNDAEETNASEEEDTSEGENSSEENNVPEESENESTPANDGSVPGNENKSTQIHLHIDKCVNPVEIAYVQVNGEWEEMTNPGSSPLFKAFDDGEFIKDDVTAFKLIFTTGEELVVPVSEVRVGVEAQGSVNYWLDNCELPAEEPSEQDESEDTDETVNILSMIRIMIDETPLQIEKVTLVMMSGKRVEFERINELFSLTLTEGIQLEMIRGIEVTGNGETKLILLSQIKSLEIVESVLTLQLNWDMYGEVVEEEQEESEGETDSTAPGNDSGSGNTSDGTTSEQVWNGEVLPQTGESSRTMFYVLGFLIAAGGIMLRFRNPLNN